MIVGDLIELSQLKLDYPLQKNDEVMRVLFLTSSVGKNRAHLGQDKFLTK